MANAADIEAYTKDGVVCLRDVFDPSWIKHLRNWTDTAMSKPGPHAEEYTANGGAGRAFNDLDLARRHDGFREFVHKSPAAQIAGTIMQSDKVNFFYDQLIVKEPNTAERTPWHQDQPYWAVSGRQVCSIWLPLDLISKQVSVQYVAGSHEWAEHNPHHFADDSPYAGTDLPELPDIDANLGEYNVLTWDMEPGDCLVFQGMIVHGAPGNSNANTRRRALATRWTGDDARYLIRPGETGVPTRDPGILDGEPMDCEDFPVIWRSDAKAKLVV